MVKPLAVVPRPVRFDLDYAAWHRHLAARHTPSRPLQFPERQRVDARRASTGRVVPLDLAEWHAHLSGARRRAA